MSKASPGPWRWQEGRRYGWLTSPDGVVLTPDGPAAPIVSEADALLISRAPDLLAMVRELEWGGICEGRRNQCCSCLNFQDEGHAPDCRLAALLKELT